MRDLWVVVQRGRRSEMEVCRRRWACFIFAEWEVEAWMGVLKRVRVEEKRWVKDESGIPWAGP